MNWINKEIEDSRQEGLTKGKLQGRLDTARQLLALGLLTDEQIANAAKLSLAQIEQLKRDKPEQQ